MKKTTMYFLIAVGALAVYFLFLRKKPQLAFKPLPKPPSDVEFETEVPREQVGNVTYDVIMNDGTGDRAIFGESNIESGWNVGASF